MEDEHPKEVWPSVLDNSGDGPVRVPGLNPIPLYWVSEERFATFSEGFIQKRLTAREVAMLGVMNALTDKPDWQRKVMDDTIAAKWCEEARAMPLISEKAWEWILTELRDKAALHAKTGTVLVLDVGSRVCKSDTLVSSELQQELKSAAQPLLDAPEKDWHPGSNEQVLNLVHPSLFPLVYGRSEVLASGGQVPLDNIFSANGKGTIHPLPGPRDPEMSHRFQWLPCDVEFTGKSATDVKIVSYINNLHPRHRKLYSVIEQLISLSIGPWNDVLLMKDGGGLWAEAYMPRNPPRIIVYDADHEPDIPPWREWDGRDKDLSWMARKTDEYKAFRAKVVQYLDLSADVRAQADQWVSDRMDDDDAEDEHEDDDDDDEEVLDHRWETKYGLEQAVEIKHKKLRKVKHPEPGETLSFEDWKAGKPPPPKNPGSRWELQEDPHAYYDIHLEDSFRSQGLQVIVKLASIELTPEQPSYAGGSWHVEGMSNEHIVATALYYYDVDNVTTSHLQFRTEASLDDENLSYEQDDHAPLAEIFGIESRQLRGEPAVQDLGAVSTSEGRLLVFPNTLQHRVAPFKLVNKTKPGHRRFVVLWLVDPYYRLCSARNVPPQRHDWWAEQGYNKVRLRPLPVELEDMIRKEVGEWPMGMEEAKVLRLELMKERTASTEAHSFDEYNFCEH